MKICSLVKQYATINAIPLCLVDNVFFAMEKIKGLCFAHGRQGLNTSYFVSVRLKVLYGKRLKIPSGLLLKRFDGFDFLRTSGELYYLLFRARWNSVIR